MSAGAIYWNSAFIGGISIVPDKLEACRKVFLWGTAEVFTGSSVPEYSFLIAGVHIYKVKR